MLVIATGIVEKQGLRMVEQQHAAEHVVVTDIANTFRMTAGIPHGQSKVMIAIADVLRHTRLCAGKDKNA